MQHPEPYFRRISVRCPERRVPNQHRQEIDRKFLLRGYPDHDRLCLGAEIGETLLDGFQTSSAVDDHVCAKTFRDLQHTCWHILTPRVNRVRSAEFSRNAHLAVVELD